MGEERRVTSSSAPRPTALSTTHPPDSKFLRYKVQITSTSVLKCDVTHTGVL